MAKANILNDTIDRERFYKIYLGLLNAINGRFILNEKEIAVAAKLMSIDNGEEYFTYKPKSSYIEPVENCGYQETTRIKRKLISIGLLTETKDSSDGRRKIYNFTKRVNNLPEELLFKLTIEWTTNNQPDSQ